MPRKPTLAQLREELSDANKELNDVGVALIDAREKLGIAELHIREKDQEQTNRDVQDSWKAFFLFLLSAALVWVARLPEWRTTLTLVGFCSPSSGPSKSLWTLQTLICDQLQPDGGELRLFAGIIWSLAIVTVWLNWKCDSLLATVGLTISMSIFWNIDSKLILAAVILILLEFYQRRYISRNTSPFL